MKYYALKKTLLFIILLIIFLALAFLFGFLVYKNTDLDLLIFVCLFLAFGLGIIFYFVNRRFDVYINNEEIISYIEFNKINERYIGIDDIEDINIIYKDELKKIYKLKMASKKYIMIRLKTGKLEVIPCFWFSEKQIELIISYVKDLIL